MILVHSLHFFCLPKMIEGIEEEAEVIAEVEVLEEDGEAQVQEM